MTALQKKTAAAINWLAGRAPLGSGEALITVSALARSERQLRTAAKAVLRASKGTEEAAMDEALDQLRKALK